jgi:hypothetical protein
MGHSMAFVLRPGERLIRYFRPERDDRFYLPYQCGTRGWSEFPREIAAYNIRTSDGPRSQKDSRVWGTGAIEYRPPLDGSTDQRFQVRSPYVIIGAAFQLGAKLAQGQSVSISTSSDGGQTWDAAGELHGPYDGTWRAEPAVLTRSPHGTHSVVSGLYDYRLRLESTAAAHVSDLLLVTRIQLNPRTLPEMKPGRNEFEYAAGAPQVRDTMAITPSRVNEIAHSTKNARYVSDGAQGYWTAAHEGLAEFIFRVEGDGSLPIVAVDAGGRFLDLGGGLAPDKFTAEVRKVAPVPARHPAASIAWSASPNGPYQVVWEYREPEWRDGDAISRVLRWPEVDRRIDPGGRREIYVRYRFEDLAIDSFRLARTTPSPAASSELRITHLWHENGVSRQETRRIPPGATTFRYSVDAQTGAQIVNDALIFECAAIR